MPPFLKYSTSTSVSMRHFVSKDFPQSVDTRIKDPGTRRPPFRAILNRSRPVHQQQRQREASANGKSSDINNKTRSCGSSSSGRRSKLRWVFGRAQKGEPRGEFWTLVYVHTYTAEGEKGIPVSFKLSADWPSKNCRGRMPIPTRLLRWMRSKDSAITAFTPCK